MAFIVYCLIILAYLAKEIYCFTVTRRFNIPKITIIAATFFTWYFGIVYFNGDMAFTLLNVVAHGIPYIALIWLFRKREDTAGAAEAQVNKLNIFIFLLAILGFAFLEEGIWDGLVWRDHEDLFALFSVLPQMKGKEILALLIPLLSLPQTTHYVLDGFIWKNEKPVGTGD
jgi:hypothetical protein